MFSSLSGEKGWLRIDWKGSCPYLRFRYREANRQQDRYLGPIFVSNTPLLDTILEFMDKLSIDELIRLRNTDKSWREIRKGDSGHKRRGKNSYGPDRYGDRWMDRR